MIFRVATNIFYVSRRNRLKLSEFDWVQKCNDIAAKTEGLSGREIAKLGVRWQVSFIICLLQHKVCRFRLIGLSFFVSF